MFFFASAAASSAYLVVSESFPVEVRALSIAFFYALGTGIGGIGAPLLFGVLIGTDRAARNGEKLLSRPFSTASDWHDVCFFSFAGPSVSTDADFPALSVGN